mmetsp:Transcript_16269/g.48752  ORF Transcript_16269/g.48752 Transcript_16269/m.48752 type:complete len:577 (+) Transcript_16269:190-1920(+)
MSAVGVTFGAPGPGLSLQHCAPGGSLRRCSLCAASASPLSVPRTFLDEAEIAVQADIIHAVQPDSNHTQGRSAPAGGWVRQQSPVWRRTMGRRSAATLVPHAAGAAVDAQAADGDWSFEDDDDYQLFDPLDLPEAQDQIAAETLGGDGVTPDTISDFVATASRRTAEAVGTTAAGTASLLKDAGAKVGCAAAGSPIGRVAKRAHSSWQETAVGLPKGLWNQLKWLWDKPAFQRLRFTISMANLSVRLPAILALVGTQMGLLATQVSLPMLAPLLLGTGMMFRSIKANASIIFPRIGLMVVLLWVLWFANLLMQNTVTYLRRQGAIDQRVGGAIINGSEICVLLAAVVILLSMLGINLSGLLIPAGVAVALAAKDLSHNFLAGFFLFAVQPFKLGDRVGVPHSGAGMEGGGQSAWFEGVCEKVDLRYTTIKRGRRRLLVPNAAFLTREFTVMDEEGPVLDSGRQSPQPETRLRSEGPPMGSDWVRSSVLEGRPFHADSDELHPHPSRPRHSRGRPTTERRPVRGGPRQTVQSNGSHPSHGGPYDDGGPDDDPWDHNMRQRQRQPAYYTDDEEPYFND